MHHAVLHIVLQLHTYSITAQCRAAVFVFLPIKPGNQIMHGRCSQVTCSTYLHTAPTVEPHPPRGRPSLWASSPQLTMTSSPHSLQMPSFAQKTEDSTKTNPPCVPQTQHAQKAMLESIVPAGVYYQARWCNVWTASKCRTCWERNAGLTVVFFLNKYFNLKMQDLLGAVHGGDRCVFFQYTNLNPCLMNRERRNTLQGYSMH
jgi:hypothetical protein